MKPGFRRWAIRVIRLVVAVMAVRLLWVFPWKATAASLVGADPAIVAAALLVNLTSLIAKGWGWHLLLEPVAPSSWRCAQEANLLGAAVNNLSISIIGEGERASYLSRRTGAPMRTVVASVVWARMVEASALGVILIGAAFRLELPTGVRIGMIAGGAALVSVSGLGRFSRAGASWSKIPEAVRTDAATFARIGTPSRLVIPFFLALINWGAEWETFHLTLLALHLPVTPAASLAALLATNLGGAARLTPGNIGVFQSSMFLGLLPFGITSGGAVAAGLVLQALQVLPVLAAAGALFGWRQLRTMGGGTTPESESSRARPGLPSGPVSFSPKPPVTGVAETLSASADPGRSG
jgi:uncharacterized membrane protein YbhN (UPF0104 family)